MKTKEEAIEENRAYNEAMGYLIKHGTVIKNFVEVCGDYSYVKVEYIDSMGITSTYKSDDLKRMIIDIRKDK